MTIDSPIDVLKNDFPEIYDGVILTTEQSSRDIDKLIIHALTNAISELVVACTDESGNPKAPDIRSFRRASASLPKGYQGSISK